MKKLPLSIFTACTLLVGCSNSLHENAEKIFDPKSKTPLNESSLANTITHIANSKDPLNTSATIAANIVADKVSENVATAIDEAIGDSQTDIEVTGIEKSKPRFEISNTTGLISHNNGHAQTFLQVSANSVDARTTLNAGLGQRFLTSNEKFIFGANAFFDYNTNYGHQRTSVGVEVKSNVVDLNGNYYHGLTGWKSGKNGFLERALDGYDVEVGVQVPYIPSAKLYYKHFEWDFVDVADLKGGTLSLGLSHLFDTGLGIEVGHNDYENALTDESFVKLSYNISLNGLSGRKSKPFISSNIFENESVKNRMLEKVRRNNSIVVQTKFSSGVGGV